MQLINNCICCNTKFELHVFNLNIAVISGYLSLIQMYGLMLQIATCT